MRALGNMPFGRFRLGSSVLHRLDPRAKLLGLATVMMGGLLAQSWTAFAFPAAAVIASAALSNPARGDIRRDVWSLRFFYLLTLLLHLLFTRTGEALAGIGGVGFTSGGLNAGLFFSVKIASLAVLAGAVNRTTHPASWSKAVEAMTPSRGWLQRIIGRPELVMGLALRMLPTMLAEAERIRTAQIARGLNPRMGGIVRRIRNLLPLAAPLLNATLRRADVLSDAMLARGYRLDAPRTSWRPLRLQCFDWFAMIFSFGTGLAAALLP